MVLAPMTMKSYVLCLSLVSIFTLSQQHAVKTGSFSGTFSSSSSSSSQSSSHSNTNTATFSGSGQEVLGALHNFGANKVAGVGVGGAFANSGSAALGGGGLSGGSGYINGGASSGSVGAGSGDLGLGLYSSGGGTLGSHNGAGIAGSTSTSNAGSFTASNSGSGYLNGGGSSGAASHTNAGNGGSVGNSNSGTISSLISSSFGSNVNGANSPNTGYSNSYGNNGYGSSNSGSVNGGQSVYPVPGVSSNSQFTFNPQTGGNNQNNQNKGFDSSCSPGSNKCSTKPATVLPCNLLTKDCGLVSNSNSAGSGISAGFSSENTGNTNFGLLVPGSSSGSYGNNFGTQPSGSQNSNTASSGSLANSGNYGSTIGLGETNNPAPSPQGSSSGSVFGGQSVYPVPGGSSNSQFAFNPQTGGNSQNNQNKGSDSSCSPGSKKCSTKPATVLPCNLLTKDCGLVSNSNFAGAGISAGFGSENSGNTNSGLLVPGSSSGSYGNNFGTQPSGFQNSNTASSGSLANSGNYGSTIGLGETNNPAPSPQGSNSGNVFGGQSVYPVPGSSTNSQFGGGSYNNQNKGSESSCSPGSKKCTTKPITVLPCNLITKECGLVSSTGIISQAGSQPGSHNNKFPTGTSSGSVVGQAGSQQEVSKNQIFANNNNIYKEKNPGIGAFGSFGSTVTLNGKVYVVPSGPTTAGSGKPCCNGPYPGPKGSIYQSKPASSVPPIDQSWLVPAAPASGSSVTTGQSSSTNNVYGGISTINPSISGSVSTGSSSSSSSATDNSSNKQCCKGPFPGPKGSIYQSKPASSVPAIKTDLFEPAKPAAEAQQTTDTLGINNSNNISKSTVVTKPLNSGYSDTAAKWDKYDTTSTQYKPINLGIPNPTLQAPHYLSDTFTVPKLDSEFGSTDKNLDGTIFVTTPVAVIANVNDLTPSSESSNSQSSLVSTATIKNNKIFDSTSGGNNYNVGTGLQSGLLIPSNTIKPETAADNNKTESVVSDIGSKQTIASSSGNSNTYNSNSDNDNINFPQSYSSGVASSSESTGYGSSVKNSNNYHAASTLTSGNNPGSWSNDYSRPEKQNFGFATGNVAIANPTSAGSGGTASAYSGASGNILFEDLARIGPGGPSNLGSGAVSGASSFAGGYGGVKSGAGAKSFATSGSLSSRFSQIPSLKGHVQYSNSWAQSRPYAGSSAYATAGAQAYSGYY